MNIGLVTDTYFPRVNGVAKSIHTFAESFKQLGHQVIIFAPQFPEHQETDQSIWRFPSQYLFFNPEDRLPNPFTRESKRLFNQLPELKLDIVHTQTPFALGIAMVKYAKKLGLPTIHTYHTLFEAYMPHYFPFVPKFMSIPFAKKASQYLCNLHDYIIVPSTSIEERLNHYGVKRPIKVLPTGTDLSPFKQVDGQRMREKYKFGDDDQLLLTMGRVAHEKNLPFLLDVLEKLIPTFPRAKLVIAGVGPALESVKAETKKRQLNDKVIFIGLLSRQDWADLYAAADINLLASVTETQGLVLTEAMAAGTPCVAVAAMGVKDVMAGGGGLAVNLDVAEFAGAVQSLLTNKALYNEKLQEAAVQAKNWSAETKAAEMLATYQNVIDEKKKSSS